MWEQLRRAKKDHTICQLDGQNENSSTSSSSEFEPKESDKESVESFSEMSESSKSEEMDNMERKKKGKKRRTQNFSQDEIESTNNMAAKDQYFRNIEDIEQNLQRGPANIPQYLGSLRSSKGFIVLRKGYISMVDCDNTNQLKPYKPENIVFIKALPCENEKSTKRHVFICLRCNSKSKANAIISTTGTKQIMSNLFVKNNLEICKHVSVAEALYTLEEATKSENNQTNCNVLINNTKQHMAACFDGKTHGLVSVNLARRGNKGKCFLCKSIRCSHVMQWNRELKDEVLKENYSDNNKENTQENSKEANEEKRDEEKELKSELRLKLPLSEHTQKLMQRKDDHDYDDKEHFVNAHTEGTACLPHNNSWDGRCPIENNWCYANNIKIAHSKYVRTKERKIYYRPTIGSCNCRLPYDGEDDMVLEVGGPGRTRQQNGAKSTATLVSLSLLFDFSLEFFETAQTMRGFYRSYKAKCVYKYGMKEEEVISWNKWRQACNIFWKDIFVMDLKKNYTCKSCGPRPHTLVVDGIALGIQTKQFKKYMKNMTLYAPYSSPAILKGSDFSNRMFVKEQSNRNILRKAAINRTWPKKDYEPESDPEFVPGSKRKRGDAIDGGMVLVWKCLDQLDQSNPPSEGMLKLLLNLSTKTSTTSLFQVIDEELLCKLKKFLLGSKDHNFVRGTQNIEMHQQMKFRYPVITLIILNLATEDGQLEKPVSNLLLSVVNHTLGVYNSAIKRSKDDYSLRNAGELDVQIFPNMPLLKERAKYSKTCSSEDKKAWDKLCEKAFPTHQKLTPGLFIVTCGCSQKIVYGFSMMLSGESPEMLFDIIMTRVEDDYNPNIIFDASCKLKEFGLNRKLERFLKIQITTDRFHECNHTACTDSFKSSLYETSKHVNTEAAEQVNSVLRRLGSSTTFMNPQLFIKTLSFFMAYQIMKNQDK